MNCPDGLSTATKEQKKKTALGYRTWLCCKNCEELKKCVKRFIWFSLNGHSKECSNQFHLASHIPFFHSL